MEKGAKVIINNDNDMLSKWYLENKDKREIITIGVKNESDIMAKEIRTEGNETRFKVIIKEKEYDARINMRRRTFCI